jgi:hypothetical protein
LDMHLSSDDKPGPRCEMPFVVCLSLSQPQDVMPGTPTCGPFGENTVYTRANGTLVNGTRSPFPNTIGTDAVHPSWRAIPMASRWTGLPAFKNRLTPATFARSTQSLRSTSGTISYLATTTSCPSTNCSAHRTASRRAGQFPASPAMPRDCQSRFRVSATTRWCKSRTMASIALASIFRITIRGCVRWMSTAIPATTRWPLAPSFSVPTR